MSFLPLKAVFAIKIRFCHWHTKKFEKVANLHHWMGIFPDTDDRGSVSVRNRVGMGADDPKAAGS